MILRVTGGLAIGIGLAIGVYAGLLYRFMHPELTETQLFLANWPVLAAMMALILGGALLVDR